MRVTFTKVEAKRYAIAIEREHGPPLAPRFAPGFDDLMPHDLAHYLVEDHTGWCSEDRRVAPAPYDGPPSR